MGGVPDDKAYVMPPDAKDPVPDPVALDSDRESGNALKHLPFMHSQRRALQVSAGENGSQ
jgi:hypothetical protein